MLGYEGYVTINGVIALANSADVSQSRVPIVSNALYGSSIATNGSIPLQQPHFYDWSEISASVTLDVNPDFLTIIKNMLLLRSTSVDFYLNSRKTGIKHLSSAWWQTITLSTAQDGTMSATINFVALETDSYGIGIFTDYWDNTTGSLTCSDMSGINPLNPDWDVASSSLGNLDPIPFWKTEITGLDNVKGWNFSVNQTIVKFMGCMNNESSTAQEPYVMGFGTLTADMKIDTLLPDNSLIAGWDMSGIYSGSDITGGRKGLTITINGTSFLGMTGELIRAVDPLQGNDSVDNMSWDYQVYSFF